MSNTSLKVAEIEIGISGTRRKLAEIYEFAEMIDRDMRLDYLGHLKPDSGLTLLEILRIYTDGIRERVLVLDKLEADNGH